MSQALAVLTGLAGLGLVVYAAMLLGRGDLGGWLVLLVAVFLGACVWDEIRGAAW